MESAADFPDRLSRAATGDAEAIGWLWDRHNAALLRWLNSMDPKVGEDIASEAWIEALKAIDRFNGDESQFRTWLFTIGRRKMIDHQRRNTRLSKISEPQRGEGAANDIASEAIGNVDSTKAIATIARLLPKEQAEIIFLRVLGGLDANQVASVTGKKPATIRVLQHRGLRKLAQALESQRNSDD